LFSFHSLDRELINYTDDTFTGLEGVIQEQLEGEDKDFPARVREYISSIPRDHERLSNPKYGQCLISFSSPNRKLINYLS
jgi:hypothetical protein